MTLKELIKSSLWWHGPQFLEDSNIDLYEFLSKDIINDTFEERKVKVSLLNTKQDLGYNVGILSFQGICQLLPLKKVVVFRLRSLNNLKYSIQKQFGT